MAVTPKVLIPPLLATDTQISQYTATNVRAIIDKFTVTNTSAGAETISINLVTEGGSAGNSNLIVNARAVAPSETYSCPELIGQVLEPGSFISTIASASGALAIRCSGREIT